MLLLNYNLSSPFTSKTAWLWFSHQELGTPPAQPTFKRVYTSTHITSHHPNPRRADSFLYWQSESGLELTTVVTPPGTESWALVGPPSASQLIIRLIVQVRGRAEWLSVSLRGWVSDGACVRLLPRVSLHYHPLPLLRSSLSSINCKTRRNWSWFVHETQQKASLINSYLFTSGILRAQPAAKSGYLKTVGFSEKA